MSFKTEIMEFPRCVIMGAEAIQKLPYAVKKLHLGGKIQLVSGATFTKNIAERVYSLLSDNGFKVSTFVVESNPVTYMDVKNLAKRLKADGSSVVLGVGGGRIIDVAKLASAWLDKPFISLPTSASHDGIASPVVSFLLRMDITENMGVEYTEARAPVAIIADTSIISSASRRSLAAGCGDLISKIVAVNDWLLAQKIKGEEYSEYAAAMALMAANIVKNGVNIIRAGGEKAVRTVVKALIGSGVSMSIAGSSRPASGAEHLFSHSLDLLSLKYGFERAEHGMQCGVGAIMMAYLHKLNWEDIRNFLMKIGAPVNAKQLGIDPEYIVEALTKAHRIRPERLTIIGVKGLTRAEAERLASETEVI
ncbi:MAG: NAD(P)-dependent glycerol-1-phosphate dehydrogenase [Candidatus Bathyarchaeia archaeon]